jgi:hypothetical protein
MNLAAGCHPTDALPQASNPLRGESRRQGADHRLDPSCPRRYSAGCSAGPPLVFLLQADRVVHLRVVHHRHRAGSRCHLRRAFQSRAYPRRVCRRHRAGSRCHLRRAFQSPAYPCRVCRRHRAGSRCHLRRVFHPRVFHRSADRILEPAWSSVASVVASGEDVPPTLPGCHHHCWGDHSCRATRGDRELDGSASVDLTGACCRRDCSDGLPRPATVGSSSTVSQPPRRVVASPSHHRRAGQIRRRFAAG